MHPIRHILVPHDFSETAEGALDLALDLAEKLGASVTLMHSYEVPTYGIAEGAIALTGGTGGEIEHAVRESLERVAERSRRPGLDVALSLRQGSAWSEIDAAAKEAGADLVVMGTHGRTGLAHVLLGSTAERVVRTAPCPVLTVRGPAGAA